jgi:hypothetical protein
MSILNDDEANRIAMQLIEDIASAADVDEAINVYAMLNTRSDQLMIGRHLMEPLTEAINNWLAGDRSPRVVNLVAVANLARRELETAEAEAQRPLPHSPNASAIGMSTVPHIAGRMTADSRVYGIPIPDDARFEPENDIFSSHVGTVLEVANFYKDYMSSDGWIFDAEYSTLDPQEAERRKLGYAATATYCKVTDPITTVIIYVGTDDRRADSTNLRMFIHDSPDEQIARAATQTTPLRPR